MLVRSTGPGACDSPQTRERACSRSLSRPPVTKGGLYEGAADLSKEFLPAGGEADLLPGNSTPPWPERGWRNNELLSAWLWRWGGSGRGAQADLSPDTQLGRPRSAPSPWEFPCLREHCYPPPRFPGLQAPHAPCGGSSPKPQSTVSDSPSILSQL